MASQKFVALDTRFLLLLEKGETSCEEVIDFFSRIRWFCVATETVREELSDLEFNASNDEVKRLAGNTLRHLSNYNILTPDLRDVERDVAKIFADRLSGMGLVKEGTQNDALILTESASHNCFFLITEREPLVHCNADAIRVALVAQDLMGCTILSLDMILEVIKQLKNLNPTLKKHA